MSQIQQLLELLQDTDAAAERFQQMRAENPDDLSALFNEQAVKKRRADLERRLSAELHVAQADLVQYHVARPETDRYPVIAVAQAVSGFQELVTAVFDAIRTTPKQRYRPTEESVALSTLDFSMALPVGSVVVSMSVENDRLIAIRSDLDNAFDRVFQILRTTESDDLRELAQSVGIASIAKAHDWAESAAKFGLDTHISIQKSAADVRDIQISRVEALSLKEAIEQKSDRDVTPEDIEGELVGIDVERPTTYFHIKAVDGRNLEGKLADTFPVDRVWAVHVTYRALVLRVQTVKYATGEESVDWLLASLEEIVPTEIETD